eukprot:scaffold5021_cov123-Isochrysis_galbana.AAC.8
MGAEKAAPAPAPQASGSNVRMGRCVWLPDLWLHHGGRAVGVVSAGHLALRRAGRHGEAGLLRLHPVHRATHPLPVTDVRRRG